MWQVLVAPLRFSQSQPFDIGQLDAEMLLYQKNHENLIFSYEKFSWL